MELRATLAGMSPSLSKETRKLHTPNVFQLNGGNSLQPEIFKDSSLWLFSTLLDDDDGDGLIC